MAMTLGSEGSPPRVREKHLIKNADGLDSGITPASAGKTDPHGLSSFEVEDHPRECGKNTKRSH